MNRYLRNNGVTFTGAALGPVSVGIFRIEGVPVPVTVPLGGTLPETDIVLTELSGQEATLAQGTNKATLLLDLRR